MDNRVVGIDQIVGGIGEEGMALVGAGPLRGRIGRRDELGCDLAGRAEGCIVECRQVLANRPAGIDIIGSPLVTRDRALLVGVCGDQAGVNRKALATYQPLAQAPLHHRLEEVPEDIALTEPAVPVARKSRVIRHLGSVLDLIEAGLSEPADAQAGYGDCRGIWMWIGVHGPGYRHLGIGWQSRSSQSTRGVLPAGSDNAIRMA